MAALLEVNNLSVSFFTPNGEVQVLRNVSFSLRPGEILAVVGESGCGKTVLCKSILKLLPPDAKMMAGSIFINGRDITHCREREMRKLRGTAVSMVLQNPMAAMHPSIKIGAQIAEAVKAHHPEMKKPQLQERVAELMRMTGIDHPRERMKQYPHQFSGGMLQRAVLASALACNPDILLADEPTTALDARIQAQILELLTDIQKKLGMAVVFVTHDLKAAAQIADRVAVMHQGEIRTTGAAAELFEKPLQIRTESKTKPEAELLLDIRHLSCVFPLTKKRRIKAVDDLSFQIYRGEIFGLVGESGCGKSTTARCIMNLHWPDAGSIFYKGIDTCNKKAYRSNRRMLQKERHLIFQDAGSSLDPRMKICDIITEPMKIWHTEPKRGSKRAEAEFQMHAVGLDNQEPDRYPAELSGGQRQRVAIARALAAEPKLLVADEPFASLDIRTRAQVVQQFRQLHRQYGFTVLLIAHDLALVKLLCDRIGVMYRGRMVECASTVELFAHPKHPYTRQLLEASAAEYSIR